MNVHSSIFITAKEQTQPKCLSTDELINKMWYIHSKKYYSAIKRNGTTYLSLEKIMLNERSQIQEAIYCMIQFI